MTPTNTELLQKLDNLMNAAPGRAWAFGQTEQMPLSAFSFGDMSRPALLLVAGVHGDEPEGVLALLDWISKALDDKKQKTAFPVLALPCVNPAGLIAGTRANHAGQDINRQFHADATPETTAVRRLLLARQLFAVVDVHTDPRAQGFYLFELLQTGTVGIAHALQANLKTQGVPLEPQPTYGGLVGQDGLLVPSPEQIARFGHNSPGQSLAEWGWERGVRRCYVLETPRALGVDAAARLHTRVLSDLLTLLTPLYSESPPQKTGPLWGIGK